MFKKWHTTGLNKGVRRLAALLAVLTLCTMPLYGHAEEETKPKYMIEAEGFEFPFTYRQDYYLVNPKKFTNCKITGFRGFTDLEVTVEQYAGHYPYMETPYVLGEALELGYGRAKVTLRGTLKNGDVKEYLLILTDPRALENSYAKVTVTSAVNMRKKASSSSEVVTMLDGGTTVYYVGSSGDWAKVQYVRSVKTNGVLSKTISYVGYVKDTEEKNYIRWNWEEVKMPSRYKAAIKALKKAHPNWSFTFVDPEITFEDAVRKYGISRAKYIDPMYYLNEDMIFAFMDIDTYDPKLWNNSGIRAIWANESTYTKTEAVGFFRRAATSLQMNPYYIACRAALESGYGGSKFAKGTIQGFEGYYNFFGIKCYDSNPELGAQYAKDRNWNTVERSIIEGANWIKDQYLDRGAVTPYFFRYSGFWNKSYMTDAQAPGKEAQILLRAYSDPDAKAHFIVPVYETQFTDLDPGAWYYAENFEAISAGLFNGMSEHEFGPEESMTRAQFVTALSRLCGVDVSTYKVKKFSDVKKEDWFYHYVAWAYDAGVTEGVSANSFAPDREITRQEMCKMLGNAIENVLGKSLVEKKAEKATLDKDKKEEKDLYSDHDSIASWAVEWVEKCSAAGIFKGDSIGNFNPDAKARRCEAACVFFRCYEKYV